MLNLNRPNPSELAKTYAPFLSQDRINRTALPQTKESKREKFERKYGMLYTAGSLVLGAGIFYALYKGGDRFKFTSAAKKYLNHYTAKTKNALSEFSDYPILQKARLKTGLVFSYIGQKALETGNIVGNINPFKDIAFDRFLKFLKVKPVFDKITSFFTKSAKKLSFSKYKRSAEDLTTFQNTLREAIENIAKMPKVADKEKVVSGKILAKKLSEFSKKMSKEFANCSDASFKKRFDATVSMLNANSEKEFLDVFKAYKGRSFWHKLVEKVKECGDFIPAKVMEKHRAELYAPLMTSKQKLSNNVLDLYQGFTKSLDDIFYNNALNNPELRKSYVHIRNLLLKYREPANYLVKRSSVRDAIIQELEQVMPKLRKISGGKEKIKALEDLANMIRNDKKGLVEEAVSACKVLKTSNPELYAKLLAERNKFQKSFNEAITFETDKTYRKLLDFSLHSIPTDLLTMGVGIGTVAAVTSNRKKSKQDKISINLKRGIPVLGGIVVSFLSNMRQVTSGTGAIFLGVISGLILNRLGTVANRFYLKHISNDLAKNNENSPKGLDKLKS